MKKLSIIAATILLSLALAGCDVTNKDMNLKVFNQDVSVSYTGETNSSGVANGKGKFVSKEDPKWSFEGTFKDGKNEGNGKVENRSIDLPLYIGNVKGTYSGEVNSDGIPNGKGKLQVTEPSKWSYEGDFKNGHLDGKGKATKGNGKVKDGDFVDDLYITKLNNPNIQIGIPANYDGYMFSDKINYHTFYDDENRKNIMGIINSNMNDLANIPDVEEFLNAAGKIQFIRKYHSFDGCYQSNWNTKQGQCVHIFNANVGGLDHTDLIFHQGSSLIMINLQNNQINTPVDFANKIAETYKPY